MHTDRRAVAALVAAVVLVAGCTDVPAGDRSGSARPGSASPSPSPSSPASPPAGSTGTAGPSSNPPAQPPDRTSLPAYFDRPVRGRALTLGAVRERTPAYTSYDASYRSDALRVTGVVNVPTGRGPFPAVVLAHGYIDPAVYEPGQGMTRERGYLAERGFVAFHVDYRNHAGSDVDPTAARRMRLGYSLDVIAAVQALRRSGLPVDRDRVALMGRSMGGGVVYKALEIEPGLVDVAVVWAPVSSLEADNFNRWIRPDGARSTLATYVERRYGLPEQRRARGFWRRISARTYFHRITEPLLIVQGGSDDICPPRWARASYRALRAAGVDAELAWYDGEEHAFGPRFDEAMARTVRYLEARLD